MGCIIGICGGTASGKSTIASLAAREIGATLLELDWFYHDHNRVPRTSEGKKNFDHPNAFEWPLLQKALSDLRAGKPATAPTYRYDVGRTGTRTVPPARIVVFEGILALHDPFVRALLDARFFVDAPQDVRFARRVARDQRERNVPEKAVLDRLSRTVRPMHEAYVEPQRAHADMVIDGTNAHAYQSVVERARQVPYQMD